MDADIAEQLARRDRYRRHLWSMQTWEERLADLHRHQATCAALLQASPTGYAAFLRRNYQKRSTDWTEAR